MRFHWPWYWEFESIWYMLGVKGGFDLISKDKNENLIISKNKNYFFCHWEFPNLKAQRVRNHNLKSQRITKVNLISQRIDWFHNLKKMKIKSHVSRNKKKAKIKFQRHPPPNHVQQKQVISFDTPMFWWFSEDPFHIAR